MESLGFHGPDWMLAVAGIIALLLVLINYNTVRILFAIAAILAVPTLGAFGIIHGSALIVGAVAVLITGVFGYVLVKAPRGVNITHNVYVRGDRNYTSSTTSYTDWTEIKDKE